MRWMSRPPAPRLLMLMSRLRPRRCAAHACTRKHTGATAYTHPFLTPLAITTTPYAIVNRHHADPPQVGLTGKYELVGVVTHKGKEAEGGHYVAWAKEDGHGEWLRFDDDKVCFIAPCLCHATAGETQQLRTSALPGSAHCSDVYQTLLHLLPLIPMPDPRWSR
jgi:ubiquitin carboxyl-terminal hydrolase